MILYVLLFVIILLFVSGYIFSGKVINIKLKSKERIREIIAENPEMFNIEWFESLTKEKVFIQSPFGYRLPGYYIPSEKPSDKTIIFCHGITMSHVSSIKYAQMFYNRGWNLFLYDHRRHGECEGKMTGYGYYEKKDLKAVVDYVRERTGPGGIVGLHGESMGAAIILQYGGMEGSVDFYIADCPYSSLWEQLAHLLKRDYHLPVFPFMYIADIFIRLRAKFSIKDVKPIDDVMKIDKPVLFIHGDADDYVPTSMSVEMYERKKGLKEIYLALEAGHALSIKADPKNYENKVFAFLRSIGIPD